MFLTHFFQKKKAVKLCSDDAPRKLYMCREQHKQAKWLPK